MAILFLELQNFRNHLQTAFLAESSGIHVFLGANGSGKTSILEAIYYLGHGRSFRTSKKDLLIHQNFDNTILRAQIQVEQGVCEVGMMRCRSGDVKWQMDQTKLESQQGLFKLFPVKLLNTHSHVLLEGEPKFRRNLLNWGVFYTESEFFNEWKRYTRALKQRNQLLSTGASLEALEPWNHVMVESGERISNWQQNYLKALIPEIHANLHAYQLPQLDFEYVFGWNAERGLLNSLESSIHQDRSAGFTKSGIHRADLAIKKQNITAHQVLSRGQQKSLLCAIMLAQGRLLQAKSDIPTTYLLDDLMAELDSKMATVMMQQLESSGSQVFLTAIEREHLRGMRFGASLKKMFHVEHGQVKIIE